MITAGEQKGQRANMSITDEYELYRRELELILRQNPIECELYSVIAELLRRRESIPCEMYLPDGSLLWAINF
jgi:hypothetical protein